MVFLFAAILVVWTYVLLFKRAFHGLDVSDEGMYLLSVHNVAKNAAFHNPFGDYTGLLYSLSSQKLWLFRIFGFLVLGLSGIYLSTSINKLLSESANSIVKWCVTFSGLLICPFYYALGILTPSYNWLNLVCLCIGVGAILRIHSVNSSFVRFRQKHLVLLAAAIWVGSFAKLSTGPGLFLIYLSLAILTRRRTKCLTQEISFQFVLLGCFAVLHHVFVSPLNVVAEKISRGQKALEIFDPTYSIDMALNSFKKGSIDWLSALVGNSFTWPLLAFALLLVVSRLSQQMIKQLEKLLYIVVLLPIASGICSGINGNWSGVVARYNDQMWAVTQILSLIVLTILPIAFLFKEAFLASFLWFGTLLGVPVLYAFGSNNGFIMQITGATGVIGLAGFCLLASVKKLQEPLIAVTFLVLAAGALATTNNSGKAPYRQAPVSEQTVRIEIAPGSGRLYVDKELASDINSLRTQVPSRGWLPRTPLLDFTEYSPGIVYALDAQAPITVVPTVGGMAGVNALAEWSFDYIASHDKSKTWADAWLLTPSESKLINCQFCPDMDVLSKLGRLFPNDYELVAKTKNYQIYKPRD